MKIQEYYAYDVYLENNELVLAKYQVSDENIEDERGKLRTYRSYHLLDVEIPDNIENTIAELTFKGYFPIQKFTVLSFNVRSNKPLVNAKFFLLGMNHRLLEKTYSVGSGYDNLNITTSVTYINMKTGKISSAIVDVLDLNEEVIKQLEEKGYVPMENSFYQNLINQQGSEMKR